MIRPVLVTTELLRDVVAGDKVFEVVDVLCEVDFGGDNWVEPSFDYAPYT